MALLNKDIPPDAWEVTLERLQGCLARYCIIRYSTDHETVLIMGIVASITIPKDHGFVDASITVAPPMTTVQTIVVPTKFIEYIYKLSPE